MGISWIAKRRQPTDEELKEQNLLKSIKEMYSQDLF